MNEMTEEIYYRGFGYGFDQKDPTIVKNFPWQQYKEHALASAEGFESDLATFFDQRPQGWYNQEWLRTGAALGALGYFTQDPELVRRFYNFMTQSDDRVKDAVQKAQVPQRVRSDLLVTYDIRKVNRTDSFIDCVRAIAVLGDTELVDYALQAAECSTQRTVQVAHDLGEALAIIAQAGSHLSPEHPLSYLSLPVHHGLHMPTDPQKRACDIAGRITAFAQMDLTSYDLMDKLEKEAALYAKQELSENTNAIHQR